MSELPMRGHFRYLRFKTFPTTSRTPQCKVFWALLSSSEHSGVPEDSQPPTFPSVGLHPKLGQSGVATGITYNNSPNITHGRTITLFNAYHKVTEWFLHHMNGPVLFKRYTQNLDTLELSILIAFLLLITIGEVCMFKFETSLLGVNNVIG